MIEMTLPDMTCGHCASTVTQACELVDPAAKIEVDIATKKVKIESAEGRAEFAAALADAGYPPAS
jgi:copper chaperone